MEPIEVFQILGIEQTKDERALKNAYRDKLTVTNPEDDPEGFKRLRMAYEEACRYAGTPDAEENEEAEPEPNTKSRRSCSILRWIKQKGHSSCAFTASFKGMVYNCSFMENILSRAQPCGVKTIVNDAVKNCKKIKQL